MIYEGSYAHDKHGHTIHKRSLMAIYATPYLTECNTADYTQVLWCISCRMRDYMYSIEKGLYEAIDAYIFVHTVENLRYDRYLYKLDFSNHSTSLSEKIFSIQFDLL